MLSRIANNLFWMTRYLERAENMVRFINVNYFSSLDAPVTIGKPFVLDSILRMNGDNHFKGTEHEILHRVTFDKSNPNAMINLVVNARENARSARDMISTELWESINRYYHFVINYDVEAYKKTHLFEFANQVNNHNMIIKGRVDSTLVHNNVWDIIKLGFHIERCIQILRALTIKLEDIRSLESFDKSNAANSHQLATLLRGLESFDMSRKHYKRAPTLHNSLEFLLLNPDFPRSLLFCMIRIGQHLGRISQQKHPAKDSVEFLLNKNLCMLQYSTIEELSTDLESNLQKFIGAIYTIAMRVEQQYLS